MIQYFDKNRLDIGCIVTINERDGFFEVDAMYNNDIYVIPVVDTVYNNDVCIIRDGGYRPFWVSKKDVMIVFLCRSELEFI
jgi:hypothetical protein